MKSGLQSSHKPTTFTFIEPLAAIAIIAVNPASLIDHINWVAAGTTTKV